MPPAVFLPGRGVAEVVLLAQFVGDARGRRIEIAGIAHDFGSSAAVVGQVAQRGDVDAIVRPAARPAAAVPPVPPIGGRGGGQPLPPRGAPGNGSRNRQRNARRLQRRASNRRLALAVDADGIDEHLALPNLLLEIAHAELAGGVVAVGDHDQRLLAILTLLGERDGFGHRVVHRRPAVWRHPVERPEYPLTIAGPSLRERSGSC